MVQGIYMSTNGHKLVLEKNKSKFTSFDTARENPRLNGYLETT